MEEQQPAAGVPEPSQKPPEEKTEETRLLFDHRKVVQLNLPAPSLKQCVLRIPTDDEWIEAHRQVKLVRHNLGRGQSKTDQYGLEAAHFALFRQIREDEKGPDFDQYEASRAVRKLMQAEPLPPEANGSGCTIGLVVLADKMETRHVMQYPSMRDEADYDRQSTHVIDLPGGKVEVRSNLGVRGEFYDRLLVENHGYAEGAQVPLAHKVAVMNELMQAVSELEVQADDPH